MGNSAVAGGSRRRVAARSAKVLRLLLLLFKVSGEKAKAAVSPCRSACKGRSGACVRVRAQSAAAFKAMLL